MLGKVWHQALFCCAPGVAATLLIYEQVSFDGNHGDRQSACPSKWVMSINA